MVNQLKNNNFMMRQPLGSVQGHASDIEIEAREILKIRNRINRLSSKSIYQPCPTA
ncbi:ATP-dependent Clp protease, protease subunit [Xenorhabdus japonica]|uniref:ATP-dependent Clp protease, protease subunit n=2 Tax=Xenorhabdus japonica TaxID=53341 RepID=A0A1I5AWN9_9GAMM|nr:ATP-dependent Clp protease, protease subunit [Xenorhabdus japonica]